jgi:quinol monooxygenase YgiN
MTFIVQTKTYFEPDTRDEVIKLSFSAYEIFKMQKGLVSVHMHLSHKGDHTMTLLVWETEKDHLACMNSPDFGQWNQIWQDLINNGKLRWELDTYESIDP